MISLIKVTRSDVERLIEKGYLKTRKGRFPELHITSKQKKGKRKNYYIPDYFAEKLI